MRRYLFNFAGGVCLVLGLAGVFLPLLPTTPFVLLASACFMRGSERFDTWLRSHKTFGPILNDWQRHRGVSERVKKRAAVAMVVSFAISIWIVPLIWLKIALLVGLCVLLSWFLRLPVPEVVAHSEENH